MKRQLLECAQVFPYTQETVMDRLGFLSAIVGIHVLSADADAMATVTLHHSDTDSGSYERVVDARSFLDKGQLERDLMGKPLGAFVEIPIKPGELVNVDVDLLGCARFIKIHVEYTGTVDASLAIALGDSNQVPLE